MLKIQIADTDIDINSHNYHKNDTRNLRLGLVISANDSVKKNILLLTVLNMHNKGSGWRFGVGVQNHRGSGGRESPSGIQGRSPGRGFMGTKSPRS